MKYRLICISGPDGTGKTTQTTLLIDSFNKLGIKYEYKWLRFHHLFSLPVLALARVFGLSEVVIQDGEKIGYHYFHRSQIISALYKTAMFLDTVIFTIYKVYIPLNILKKRIICDRFIYDTIVDLMISTGQHQIYKSPMGKLLLRLIPYNSKIVILISDEDSLVNRRNDLSMDNNLGLKIKLYDIISKEFGLPTIEASLTIDEVNEKLKEIVNE